MLNRLINQHGLVLQLLKNDLAGRYRGTLLGLAWSLINPAVMLAIYFVMFTYVFEAKWQQDLSHKGGYAMFIVSGILLHVMLAEVLTKSPNVILGSPSFVKKVVFPLAMLPLNVVLSAFVNFMLAFSLVYAACLVMYGFNPWFVVVAPFLFASVLCMLLGIAFFLAATTVYFRDIGQIMGQVASIMLFISPVLYPTSAAPAALRPFLYLSPITIPIEEIRSMALMHNPPNITNLAIYAAASIVVLLLGYTCFRRLRSGFADVV